MMKHFKKLLNEKLVDSYHPYMMIRLGIPSNGIERARAGLWDTRSNNKNSVYYGSHKYCVMYGKDVKGAFSADLNSGGLRSRTHKSLAEARAYAYKIVAARKFLRDYPCYDFK